MDEDDNGKFRSERVKTPQWYTPVAGKMKCMPDSVGLTNKWINKCFYIGVTYGRCFNFRLISIDLYVIIISIRPMLF